MDYERRGGAARGRRWAGGCVALGTDRREVERRGVRADGDRRGWGRGRGSGAGEGWARGRRIFRAAGLRRRAPRGTAPVARVFPRAPTRFFPTPRVFSPASTRFFPAPRVFPQNFFLGAGGGRLGSQARGRGLTRWRAGRVDRRIRVITAAGGGRGRLSPIDLSVNLYIEE